MSRRRLQFAHHPTNRPEFAAETAGYCDFFAANCCHRRACFAAAIDYVHFYLALSGPRR